MISMYIAVVIYVATYVFSAYKIWTLSLTAILETQVASLKALNDYVDQLDESAEDSDSIYEKLYREIEATYDAVRLGARKSSTINMLYLCPMVLFFSIFNGEDFEESYMNEYKSEILPELRSALRETGLSGSALDTIISKTSSYLAVGANTQ